MKKTIALIFIASVLATSLGTAAFAVEPLPVGFEGGLPTIATSGRDAITIIGLLTNWLFVILSVTAVIFIVLAAFQFITSGGNPEAIGEARRKLLYAAIGIVIALVARAIPFVLASIIGAGGAVGGVGGGGGGTLVIEVSGPDTMDSDESASIVVRSNGETGDNVQYELDCDASNGLAYKDSIMNRPDNDGFRPFPDECEYSETGAKEITIKATQNGNESFAGISIFITDP